MKKNFKPIIIIIVILALAGFAVAYAMWNKPQRKVEDEKGIVVTSAQLVKDYQANENEANKKYLDKAIEVNGTITEVKKNQDGKATITLTSEDAFTGVFCTLKTDTPNLAAGSAVTIKGICSGMLTDVRLREAVVVK
ncbi:MAG TPA: hypothetical protein VF623_10905 [Segetibacter sp.]